MVFSLHSLDPQRPEQAPLVPRSRWFHSWQPQKKKMKKKKQKKKGKKKDASFQAVEGFQKAGETLARRGTQQMG